TRDYRGDHRIILDPEVLPSTRIDLSNSYVWEILPSYVRAQTFLHCLSSQRPFHRTRGPATA
ncbi:hypothetical protein PanWU01x14_147720, partial [Parasponia andersonii]